MKAIRTDLITPGFTGSETEKLWIYNGLDAAVTLEIFQSIHSQLDNVTAATYHFSRSLQNPALDMRCRGVLVDQYERAKVIREFSEELTHLESRLNQLLLEGLDVVLNWRSPAQLKTLFYEILGIPPVVRRGKITVDRDALERLQSYFFAEPIISYILAMRDLAKKIGVLRTDIDSDGRMRTSYNIAGTTTGRFSSSLSDFGTGTNLQNIEEKLRRIFIADPGMKFAYIDLEQAESRLVGAIEWNLFRDGRYLDACESGDLHTSVCKLAWPTLPWTGSLSSDRKVAETPFYRQHSHRHMAKVLGHGTNYNGQPYTMAKHTKLKQSVIAEFQARYFAAFPAHQRWHSAVAAELLETGYLISLTGRKRWFFGRRNDPATIREAIAFDPQGSVGDILNKGMLKVWNLNICELLLQVHDAILVQYPEERENEILPTLLEEIKVPIELAQGRTLIIPSEAKVGWNWSNHKEKNPDGLKTYTGNDSRKRTSRPTDSLVDRIVSRLD